MNTPLRRCLSKAAVGAACVCAPAANAVAIQTQGEAAELTSQGTARVALAVVQGTQADDATVMQWVRQGLDARGLHHHDEAIRWLGLAREARPKDLIIGLDLAVAYEWSGRLTRARSVYEQLVQAHAESAAAWVGLGRVCRWQNQWLDARRAYGRALDLVGAAATPPDPLRLEAMMGLAQLDFESLKLESAWQQAQAVLSLSPDHVEAQALQRKLQTTYRDNAVLTLGRRTDAVSTSTMAQWDWTHHWDSLTRTVLGLGRGMSAQPSASSPALTVTAGNTVYALWTRDVPGQDSTMAKLQWQTLPAIGSTWRLDATHSTLLESMPAWRVHAGLHLLRSSVSDADTLEFGATAVKLKPFDLGLTAYVGQERNDLGGSVARFDSRVILLRTGWNEQGHQLQWFVAKALSSPSGNDTPLSHALVAKFTLPQGPVISAEAGLDGASGQRRFALGLEWPLGPSRGLGLRTERTTQLMPGSAYTFSAAQSWNGLAELRP